MPRNVEIKARLTHVDAQRARVAQLADAPPQLIQQEDVFFNVPQGRLKLRLLSPTHGQLIFYQRSDHRGPKTSMYELMNTDQPHQLRVVLAAAYGIRSIVCKTRHLYQIGRTRIHIDDVESLGDFLELEVVLADSESPSVGEREARELMQKLGICETQLVKEAYVDLLQAQNEARDT